MKARGFLLGSGLLLMLFANAALAGGSYQRTKDQKTIIWNPDPKPEDAANWSGARDHEEYATGSGTLTWYKIERKYGMGSRYSVAKDIFVIRYSGNMVRGKLEGVVVAVDAEGNRSHATFADGSRSEDWIAGPGPNQPGIPSASPPGQSPGPTEQSPARTLTDQSGQRATVAEAPAAKPSPAESVIRKEEVKQSVTEHSAVGLSLQKYPATARPSDQSPNAGTGDRTTMELQTEVFFPEPTPIPANRRIAQKAAKAAPAERPLAAKSPAPSPTPAKRAGKDLPVANEAATPTRGRTTDILQALALPPESSALKKILVSATLPGMPAATTTPLATEPSPSPSTPPPKSSPPAGPRLTTAEVIAIADEEARGQGYDLVGYQCSKVDYTVAGNTWSVWYEPKPVEGAAKTGKRFRVAIDDKTKKGSVALEK